MGAWGHKIEDNDTAQDFYMDFEESLKSGLSVDDAIAEYRDSWYFQDNWSILCIADVQMKYQSKLDDDIKVAVQKSISEELSMINDWRYPHERKLALEEFEMRVRRYI